MHVPAEQMMMLISWSEVRLDGRFLCSRSSSPGREEPQGRREDHLQHAPVLAARPHHQPSAPSPELQRRRRSGGDGERAWPGWAWRSSAHPPPALCPRRGYFLPARTA